MKSLAYFFFFGYNKCMEKLIVTQKYDNKKLSKIVLDEKKEIHYPLFCKLLRKKDIKVNGKRVNKDIIVHEKDEITLYLPEEKQENKIIQIIYEDNNILVVNKDVGIEVTGKNSLTEKLRAQCKEGEKINPCHRIDRNTMGLVVFAKSEKALQIMLEKFKKHEIEKHYLALVYGVPNPKSKRIKSYLFKDNKKARVYIKDEFEKGYQPIITSYTVLEKRKDNTALLDVEIETGRTHQIRAHLAYLGYPIIGDGKYGKNEINRKFRQNTQLLWAYKLKFNFQKDSDILTYLNSKEIILPDWQSLINRSDGLWIV